VCWPTDQGDPVRKREAHAKRVRKDWRGKERKRDEGTGVNARSRGSRTEMIEAPRHERSRSLSTDTNVTAVSRMRKIT